MTGQGAPLDNDVLFLTVPEAADRLRISRWSLYQLINRGDLDTVKIGRRRLVPVQALNNYLAVLTGAETPK